MSTNIHFKATRDVIVVRTGKQDTQSQYLQVWQTSTKETLAIMRSSDPVQGYVEWVLSNSGQDDEVPVYADDDVFCEREPVRVDVYNPGKEHAAQFLKTIEDLRNDGWDIQAEAW